MTEVNVHNFKEQFANIKRNLEAAKFIGIDLEFSALHPLTNCAPSLFDTPKERYGKLRKNVQNTIPLQIGLTVFKFDPDGNRFHGNVYTFYVKPGLFSHVNRYFHFESSAIEFLALHNFNFNKFVHSGIPYISQIQKNDLKKTFEKGEVYETNMNFLNEMRNILDSHLEMINAWYEEAKIGETLTLDELSMQYRSNIEFRFYFHKYIRRHFANLWIFERDDKLDMKKVTEQEFLQLEKDNNLNKEIIDSLHGFGKVYDLLVSLRKPIIGHNTLMDILILIVNFEGNLPDSYEDFKKLTMKLFPVTFDTKHIFYDMRMLLPERKRPDNNDLKSLFLYFRDREGRHLVMNSPPIDIENDEKLIMKFHNAGWDSFCCGYVFIRLAYLKIFKKHTISKVFMPTEYISEMHQYKNCVNVIRGSTNSINLNGVDPPSRRPPLYVIETYGNKKLDFVELISALGAFGSIEVKPVSWRKSKALVALDNFSSAKSMIREFEKSKKFKVQQYSFIRHSPVVTSALWGCATLTGIALLLLLRFK